MPSGTSTSSEPGPRGQSRQASSRRGDRVVAVVDDDAAVCHSTRTLLEVHDFVVLTYQSGAAFLLEQRAISCLVVDYGMPGLNGLEVVSQLRNRSSPIPVIMMTATPDARIEAEAAQLGIKSVLKKTPRMPLISALQDVLG